MSPLLSVPLQDENAIRDFPNSEGHQDPAPPCGDRLLRVGRLGL
jgi:hypothetical protein